MNGTASPGPTGQAVLRTTRSANCPRVSTSTTSLLVPFTVTEPRQVFEAVWGEPLDPRNFHRKVTNLAGFLPTPGS